MEADVVLKAVANVITMLIVLILVCVTVVPILVREFRRWQQSRGLGFMDDLPKPASSRRLRWRRRT